MVLVLFRWILDIFRLKSYIFLNYILSEIVTYQNPKCWGTAYTARVFSDIEGTYYLIFF